MRLQYEVGFVEGFVESRMKFYEDVCEETRQKIRKAVTEMAYEKLSKQDYFDKARVSIAKKCLLKGIRPIEEIKALSFTL